MLLFISFGTNIPPVKNKAKFYQHGISYSIITKCLYAVFLLEYQFYSISFNAHNTE